MSSHDPEDPNQAAHEAEISAQKEIILKQILDSDARLRLNNVKMVKPDMAAMVENYLINLASQGKVRSQISDAELKQILQSLQQPKREFKINRK